MLIDQFTEEQLAQIRRELREVQKLSKASMNDEIIVEIDRLFDRKTYHQECLFPYRDVTLAIGTIADYTMDNFVYKHHGRAKKQIGWYRAQNIPQDKENEYKEIVKEIINVIRKHRLNRQFSLKKPQSDETRYA